MAGEARRGDRCRPAQGASSAPGAGLPPPPDAAPPACSPPRPAKNSVPEKQPEARVGPTVVRVGPTVVRVGPTVVRVGPTVVRRLLPHPMKHEPGPGLRGKAGQRSGPRRVKGLAQDGSKRGPFIGLLAHARPGWRQAAHPRILAWTERGRPPMACAPTHPRPPSAACRRAV